MPTALATTACALVASLTAAASAADAAGSRGPLVPVGDGPAQYKPFVLTTSADGAEYFGGPTGHRIEPRRLKSLGRLRWTKYTATDGYAVGRLWGLYGPGPLAEDTQFQDQTEVTLHVFDPQSGVFRRLTFRISAATVRSSSGQSFRFPA